MERFFLAGLTPPDFRDDVRRRVQFKDASSDPYRVVQFMEEMLRKNWAAIDEYQRGARFSGRGGWKQPSGDGRRSGPREGRRTVRVPLSGLLEEAAGAAAQLTTAKPNALRVRRKRPRIVAGKRVVVVRQRVVRRVVLLGRL